MRKTIILQTSVLIRKSPTNPDEDKKFITRLGGIRTMQNIFRGQADACLNFMQKPRGRNLTKTLDTVNKFNLNCNVSRFLFLKNFELSVLIKTEKELKSGKKIRRRFDIIASII